MFDAMLKPTVLKKDRRPWSVQSLRLSYQYCFVPFRVHGHTENSRPIKPEHQFAEVRWLHAATNGFPMCDATCRAGFVIGHVHSHVYISDLCLQSSALSVDGGALYSRLLLHADSSRS